MSSDRKGNPPGGPGAKAPQDLNYEDLLDPLREFSWPSDVSLTGPYNTEGQAGGDSFQIPDADEIAEALQSLEEIYESLEPPRRDASFGSGTDGRRPGTYAPPPFRSQSQTPVQPQRDSRYQRAEHVRPVKVISEPREPVKLNAQPRPARLPRPGTTIEGRLNASPNQISPIKNSGPLRARRNIVDVLGEPVEDAKAKSRKGPAPSRVEDEDKKRRKIHAYFGKKSAWSYVPILIGLGFIVHPGRFDPFYGFEIAFDWALGVGLAIIVISMTWRYLRSRPPKDHLVDEWTVEDLNRLDKHARELMDLNNRQTLIDPVVLAGFPDIEKLGPVFRASRYGKDSVLRYTPRALTVLSFTDTGIISYEGAVDITTGSRVYEKMSEFSYSDISTVSMSRAAAPADLKTVARLARMLLPWRWSFIDRITYLFSGKSPESLIRKNSREVFSFGLVNGQDIKAVLRDGRLSGDREYDEIPNSVDESLLRHIREFVRLKKNQMNVFSDSSFLT